MESNESSPTGEQGAAIDRASSRAEARDLREVEGQKMGPVATAAEAEATAGGIDSEIDRLFDGVRTGAVSTEDAKKQFGTMVARGSAAVLHFASRASVLKDAEQGARPAWVIVPTDLVIPTGRPVVYLRFKSEWTDLPNVGGEMPDRPGKWRQLIMWPLTDSEEGHANKRAQNDGNQAVREQTKQMIRAIDGKVADWSGRMSEPSSIDRVWNELGSRCRGQLLRVYTQLTVLPQVEQADFFENCVEVRIGG